MFLQNVLAFNGLHGVISQQTELSRYSDGLGAGNSEFYSRKEQETFPFPTASRPALGLTHPPVPWVPGTLTTDVKRLGREADDSPPSI
jgi:hypothetical protein